MAVVVAEGVDVMLTVGIPLGGLGVGVGRSGGSCSLVVSVVDVVGVVDVVESKHSPNQP